MITCLIRQNWTYRSILILITLLGLGFAGNFFEIKLFMGFHYLFGSIAVLIVMRLYGGLFGLIAALLAASYTQILFGHPYALLWLGLEPLVVGYLVCRGHARNMVIADAMYWPIIGGPLLFLIFNFTLGVDGIGTLAAILMYWVIGITNSLIASLIIDHLPLRRWSGDREPQPPVPIHNLLFNLFMTIILVPAIIMMVTGARRTAADYEALAIDKVQDTYRNLGYEMRLHLAQYNGEIQELLDASEHSNLKDANSFISETAHHTFTEYPELIAIRLLDQHLKPLLTIPERYKEYDLSSAEREFLQKLLHATAGQVQPFLSLPSNQRPAELLLAARFNNEGGHLGVIILTIDPASRQKMLQRMPLPGGQTVTITDDHGRVLTSTRSELRIGDYFDPCTNLELHPVGNGIFRCLAKQQKQVPLWQRSQQASYIKEAVINPALPWILTVEHPYAPLQQQLMAEHARNLAGLIGLCIMSLGLSLYLANRLTTPLRQLSALTTDLPTKLSLQQDLVWPASNIAELEQLINNSQTMAAALTDKFNELAEANVTLEDRVTERTRELTEANAFLSMEIHDRMKAEDERDNYLASMQQQLEFLELLLEAIPNPIYFKDRQGHYLGCNSAYLKFIDRDKDALIGNTVYQIYPQELAEMYQLADESLFNRGGVQQYESQLGTTIGGIPREVIFYKATYGAADNKIAGLVGVVLDITDRKRVESERDQLMFELTQKNKELEGIVYAASHDLRSPLINIEGFSRKVAKSCIKMADLLGGTTPDSENIVESLEILRETIPKALNFINTSTEKMDLLLKGLLRLSRMGRAAMHIEPVNMNQLLEQVTAAMSFQLQNCDASLNIGTLPTCLADAAQINQIFSNLLDNAIKYRAPDRHLTIQISGNLDGNQVVYLVTDNGIGIAPEHVERIWEIFHRLNPKGTDGEGLGLTIVRRLIDRNNGNVRIESTPGLGSTFIISLPAGPTKISLSPAA